MQTTKNLTALLGVMAIAGTLAGAAHADEKMNPTDHEFVNKVSQGNRAEIKSSQLALTKSRDKRVLMIATMLIQQHGKAQKDLKTVAQMHHVTLPAGTDSMHRQEYRMLSRMSGPSFDKLYMKGQVRDHNMTIALFNKELGKGNETHVRSFAAKYLPDIQNHTGMIHNVASNLGIPVAASKMAAMAH